jgi:hypothetical protein
MAASGGTPYLLCFHRSCLPNSQGRISFAAIGGTSAAAPSLAGILSLVDQKAGGRQGQVGTTLYRMAATQSWSSCNGSAFPAANCIFRDVTAGNNAVPGTPGYGTAAALYPAGIGYDSATGLGSVDAYNLVTQWGGTGKVAVITSPAPGTILSGSATFTWTSVAGADQYWLDLGNSVAQGDISAGPLASTSKTVSGLPCDGRTLYLQLWTHLSGAWQTPQRYTYTAANTCIAISTVATLSVPNTTNFTGAAVTFAWAPVAGADQYWLDVGNSIAQGDIFGSALTATSVTVSNLPCDGRTIYVQLWTHMNGVWKTPIRYTFTAWNACAVMTSPTPGTVLPSNSVTFHWSSGTGVTAYWLDVGTIPGQGNIFGANLGGALSQTVSSIPSNIGPIYVQLWSQINGAWYRNVYTYTSPH